MAVASNPLLQIGSPVGASGKAQATPVGSPAKVADSTKDGASSFAQVYAKEHKAIPTKASAAVAARPAAHLADTDKKPAVSDRKTVDKPSVAENGKQSAVGRADKNEKSGKAAKDDSVEDRERVQAKDVADDATIDDLVSTGFIKKDTALYDYITDCGDASTGDYIYNAASCSMDSSSKTTGEVASKLKNACDDSDGNSTAACNGSSEDFTSTSTGDVSEQALQAIPVFLLDYQVHQAVNGEDDPYTGGSSAPSSAAGATIDQDHIYEDSTSIACATGTTDAGVEQGYYNNKEIDVRLCTIPNTIDNGPDGNGGLIRVNSRVSGAFLALTQAFISSGQNPYGDKVRFADSFRSMAAQRQVYAQYGSGRAAAPGYSNHQMGLAVDIQLQSNNGATRPGDPTYDWLVANAKKWGITKLTSESWHWQPQAGQGSAVL